MKRYLYILLLSLLSLPMAGQVVYQCDFEDGDERMKWSMNTGKNPTLISRLENKWYIDYSGNHGETGRYGLFISNDGTHATFTNHNAAIVYAYREIELLPGTYSVSFDWRSNSSALSGEGIYVCIVPMADESVSINSAAQTVPEWVSRYALNTTVLGGKATWQMHYAEFHALESYGNNKYRLLVAWYQNATNISSPPSGMVDNIIILGEDKCEAPSNLSYSLDAQALHLSWTGNADYYDVKVYDYNEDRWQIFDPVVGKRLDIGNLTEGVHDIFIRAHCGAKISEYVLFKPFYYRKGNRCIEYLALDDQTNCRCYTGSYTNQRESLRRVSFSDLFHSNVYSGDAAPLFSLHIMPDEFDPYTDNMLRTKPVGAVASVRLGRFNPTFGACTEYNYTVPDGDHSILMLRYAVVLPNPHPNNDPPANPKFKLEVLANNKPIHDSCGIADFMASYGESASWNTSQNAGQAVYWKDWTEIAINLREYVGQKITVRLMTTGCSMSEHGGYAYYTLECEDGALTGINCGDIPTTQFVAPSGFDYAWYLPDNPGNILGRERVFDVDPMDTLTYNVDVISKTNSHCYYTLDATAIPRYPVAEATAEKTDDRCENIIVFHQTCHVKYKNQITEQEWHTDRPVERIVWDFGDGSKPLVTLNEYVTHTYPRDGGQYTATVTASIVDGLCEVQQEIPVTLQKIGIVPIVVHADVCEGDCYRYNGNYYCNSYIDTVYYQSAGGCDSTVIFDIIMHERNFEAAAELCEGGEYVFGGRALTESGVYTHTFTSSLGCDSVVTLTLEVEPKLIVAVDGAVSVCADDSVLNVPVLVEQGRLDSVYIRFGADGVMAGFEPSYAFGGEDEIQIELPDSVMPGSYDAVMQLGTPRCPAPDVPLTVEVQYPSAIIAQKDGFIALLNADYNGGYEFSSYQWYKDGQLIPGAQQSYIIVSESDLGAQYSVLLTRTGDGVTVAACPITYTAGVLAVDNVWEATEGAWTLYDVTGRVVTQSVANERPVITAAGVYILVNRTTHRAVKIVVP